MFFYKTIHIGAYSLKGAPAEKHIFQLKQLKLLELYKKLSLGCGLSALCINQLLFLKYICLCSVFAKRFPCYSTKFHNNNSNNQGRMILLAILRYKLFTRKRKENLFTIISSQFQTLF